MKALMIATGGFTPDARRFAEGKPIELIDGQTLSGLLAKYGVAAAGSPGAKPTPA